VCARDFVKRARMRSYARERECIVRGFSIFDEHKVAFRYWIVP